MHYLVKTHALPCKICMFEEVLMVVIKFVV